MAAGLAGIAMFSAISTISLADDQPPSAADEEQGEGIRVHGEWTIEVVDSDGSLVSRHEFSNALLPSGRRQLTSLLTRSGAAGRWMVRLGGPPAPGGSTSYRIVEPTAATPLPANAQPNLTVNPTAPDPVSGSEGFNLSGGFTFSQADTIVIVATALGACSETTTPQDCTGPYFGFTGTFIPPIEVQEGQTVNVIVQIRFS